MGDLKATASRGSSLKHGSTRASVEDSRSLPCAGDAADAGVHTYARERALVLKFDVRILPVLALMYLANALDKGNLGNAKTDGMEADLHFRANDYNVILSVFFVPYVLFAAPIALLGKRFGAARVLPLLMLVFGGMTLLSAAVKNFGGMMATRWILGGLSMIRRRRA